MDLYDVLSEGCHMPLTSEEIADLFRAGSFGRDEPCRRLGARSWRTLDELFPLLKYGAGGEFQTPRNEPDAQGTDVSVVIAGVIAAALLIGGSYFLWLQPFARTRSEGASSEPQAILPVVARITPPPGGITSLSARSDPNQPLAGNIDYARTTRSNLARLQEEKQQRDQLATEKAAMADRMRRENEEQAQAAQRAAGTDFVVPLDEDFPISPSLSATVKVHDNDVTSFDIWINGMHYRDVRKRKGTTHSGADETFVYTNGRASLYYVWEVSGRVNSCLLRVREN